MAITDAPRIITGRFDYDDSYTLDRYQATGGYEALRKALTMTPDAVVSEVKEASLLGRGGAGFPAGVKWGFCPPGVWPRYLVVNGDESEPGTYKDRLLMERDPHQLIEGFLIACYAVGCAPGLPLRAGRDGPGPGAHRRRARTRPTPPASSARTSSAPTSRSTSCCTWGAGAYIVGEETALHREPRGQPRHAPAQAAVLPGGQGPLPAADDRQQRRDAVERAVDHAPTAPTRSPPSGAEASTGHPHVRRVGPRQDARRVRGRVRRHHVPRPDLRAASTPAASATATSSRRSSPAARRRRGSSTSTSTCRSRRAPSTGPARCSARAPSS